MASISNAVITVSKPNATLRHKQHGVEPPRNTQAGHWYMQLSPVISMALFVLFCAVIKKITPWMMRQGKQLNKGENYCTPKLEGKNIKRVVQSLHFFCGICMDFKLQPEMFRKGKCNGNHPFCNDCISKYVGVQIQQKFLKVNCPNPNCHVELKLEYLQSILPKEIIDRWESAMFESYVSLSEKLYCPYKDCSVILVNDKVKPVRSCECPYCHRLFCMQCKVPWHVEMSCDDFQILQKDGLEKYLDGKFLELAKAENWPKCPDCSFYVQRNGGCEHMACRCGYDFCYHCGKTWKFGHMQNRDLIGGVWNSFDFSFNNNGDFTIINSRIQDFSMHQISPK